MRKIVVIDGKGGKMGAAVVEMLKEEFRADEVYAIGTNGIATAAMMKAGADAGATGENPVVVACRDADVIIGPVGIAIADSLLGEITPKMALAVGQSRADKILMPVNKCHNFIVGVEELSINEILALVKQKLKTLN